MKKIAVLTSGGDAPGMNACIRAIVRAGLETGDKIIGVKEGYTGLVEGKFVSLGLRDVGNIIQLGGTMLKTSRCAEFMTPEGFNKAVNNCKKECFDGVVVIGGNGSLRGAAELSKAGINVIGLPGTIDNDLGYTDFTLGFDTAVNTVTNLLNNVRDTSASHQRVCVVEVMGRNCGDIALYGGLASGAEEIILPEVKADYNDICARLVKSAKSGKLSSIIVVAEGAGKSEEIAKLIEDKTGLEARSVVIGHLQRGGSPTMADRVFASRIGVMAVDIINAGKGGVAIGSRGGKIITEPIDKAVKMKNKFDTETYLINKKISI